MKLNFLKKLVKKGRKYPIRKDQFGMTRRAWAFYYFDKGMIPAQAAREAGIPVRTARRYKAQWNKRGRNKEAEYKVFKDMKTNDPENFGSFVNLWAEALGIPREEVVERLEKPWGLQQLLAGKWPNYAHERRRKEAESDLDAALKFVKFMRTMGFTPVKIDEIIEGFLKEALNRKASRERKDLTTLPTPSQAPMELENGDIRP